MNSTTHRYISADMEIFDRMHPVVRAVMRESNCSVYLQMIFKQDPNLRQAAVERPYDFALKLKRQMKKWSAQDHERGLADVKRGIVT